MDHLEYELSIDPPDDTRYRALYRSSEYALFEHQSSRQSRSGRWEMQSHMEADNPTLFELMSLP